MGHASRTLGAFWDLIPIKMQEDTFVQILHAESERFAKGSPQARLLGFLKANLEYFSPVQVMGDRCEIPSSRIEGFFAHYKNITGHEVLPLALAAKGIHLLGQIALGRRSCAQIPSLLPDIMSYADQ
jgi:hypothetical protein